MNATCFTFPSTLPGRATWAANPTCRGTFEIITLCLSTTIICIWSSIHKDIPTARSLSEEQSAPAKPNSGTIYDSLSRIERGRLALQGTAHRLHHTVNDALLRLRQVPHDVWRILRNNGPTVIVAFFCPALLLMRAIDQYSTARKLRDLGKDRKTDVPFTVVHGFYATMGGFQLDVRDRDSPTGGPFKDITFARTRLSTEGVSFLMDHYTKLLTIPTIESIKERAKSNSLGKAVLALQVVWFIVNCASRLAENLPLSLMEVSTLAHGFCTLLTYFAWWSKPLNVEGPTKLETKFENKGRALAEVGPEDDAKIARWKCWVRFFDSHPYGHSRHMEELFQSLPVDASLRDNLDARARELAKDLKILVDSLEDRYSREFREGPKYRELLRLAGEAEHAGSGEVSKDKVRDGVLGLVRDLFEGEFLVWLLREAAYDASEKSQTTPMAMALLDMYHSNVYTENHQDINIFNLLRPKSSTNPGTNSTLAEERLFSAYFLHETSPTFHDLFGAFALTTESKVVGEIDYISLSVIPLLYGSLHLLGWWKQFPSPAEQIVWRVATVVAMASGLAATVVCLIHNEVLHMIVWWLRRRNINISWEGPVYGVAKQLLQALVRWIIPSLYVLSSTFLIVESIRQLWFLPSEAYIVASWSYYFPHLF